MIDWAGGFVFLAAFAGFVLGWYIVDRIEEWWKQR